MLDKIKITITQEDGSPICGLSPEPDAIFLTDDTPFMVIRKKSGTVESVTVDAVGGMGLKLCRDLVSYLYANLSSEDRKAVFAKVPGLDAEKEEV